MRAGILFLTPLLLCACVTDVAYLTGNDKKELEAMRHYSAKENREKNENRTDLVYRLIQTGPTTTLEENIKKKDYRPIGLAMGYGASDSDSMPVGIVCDPPVETQNMVFGCVPPPAALFKMADYYNRALLLHPNTTLTKCKIDPEFSKGMKELDKYTDKIFSDERKTRNGNQKDFSAPAPLSSNDR